MSILRNRFINTHSIIIGIILFSIILLFMSHNKNKNIEHGDTCIGDTCIGDTCIEKHAKRGIEISEEEHKELLSTISKEGLLNVTTS